MKKVILLILLVPVPAFSQIVDDFEMGLGNKWAQNPPGRWSSDSVDAIHLKRSLHHVFDNNTNGDDCIALSLENLHPDEGTTKWSFLIRHGYDPSSSNNWIVYLMCDTVTASVVPGIKTNGFAVGVNLTGYDDTLRLWKIKDGVITTVIKTSLNWQNRIGTKNAAKIEVERSPSGIWNISVTDNLNAKVVNATATERELFENNWFLIRYRYTSTRDRLLWIDDLEINGVFYEDNEPPSVADIKVTGRNRLEIVFSEEPDWQNLQPSDFLLNRGSAPADIVNRLTGLKYQAVFSGDFKNKTENELLIKKLCDKRGNCSENVTVSFIPVWAEPGDILISEIMADPTPQVTLPPEEYLEITNRSAFQLNLYKFTLSFNNEKVLFPDKIINPCEYIILCSIGDTVLFKNFGKVTGLKPFPALSDDGKMLALRDTVGNLIHGIEYSSGWYGDALKKNGGWSLEIIDPDFPFFADGNWEASVSKSGGTPGKINSVSRKNEDLFFDGILNAFPDDSSRIHITFSETVAGFAGMAGKIMLNEDITDTVTSADPLLREFFIKPAKFLKEGIIYKLVLPVDLTDFAGNQIVTNTFKLGIPAIAAAGDVVFNELLFNPLPGDPDYIELYNRSENVVDVSDMFLASINETGDTSEMVTVSVDKRCLLPGTFYVITDEVEKVIDRHSSNAASNIFMISDMPSMPDSRGHLLLLNKRAEIIDEVIYTESMHHPLLSGSEGIALEKLRPDVSSADGASWHSASQSSGWGTPGLQNSVFVPEPESEDVVIFSSTRISPDNDGYEDQLVIDFNLEGTGNILSVSVFDENGVFIRKLAENYFAGTGATLAWDGTGSDGALVTQGIYIVFIQLYNDTGKTRTWKKVCSVIRY